MIISAHESGSMEVMNGVASEKNGKLKKTLSNDVKELISFTSLSSLLSVFL